MKTICPCCLSEYDDHDSPEEFKRVEKQHRSDVERAKKYLATLVDHWDEHSPNMLRNQIRTIIEEVL